jgi:sugar lactone lactonase YvrE
LALSVIAYLSPPAINLFLKQNSIGGLFVIKRARYTLAVSAACAGFCSAQIGIINTYAGNDYGSFPGNGGPATSAIITGPSGLATDASGNLYIAATGNSLIRLVNAQTGIITTAAGGGTGGDGGPATSAQLVNPCDVKVDTAGNLYISETCVTNQGGGGSGGTGSGGGGRIRRVDASTGIITTIAGGNTSGSLGDGGPATNAMLNTPGGLSLDSAGNLFIADSGNNRIRRVDAASGIITTVAGNGAAAFAGDGGPATSASLNSPFGVAVDSTGNLYIADTVNGRIRRVDAATGNITTVAGTGATAFNGDGIAATTANLNLPAYLAFDSSGNLVFGDWLNDRVRMIDNSGIIWTLAGIGNSTSTQIGDNGPASMAVLTRPIGVAVLSSGPLFISEHGVDDRIRRVALPSSVAATAVTVSAGGNSFPQGTAVRLTAALAAFNGQPYNASGGIALFDGSTMLGGGPVAGGSVSMTTSSLALGTHNISAIYYGDSNFGGSYSPVFTITIVAASTTVTMSASPNPSSFGQSVTMTATVTPSTATGWVQFYNGTTPLGSGMLYNGQAQSTAGALPVGINSLTAAYQGDANHSSATSSAIQQTVNKASTTTTLTSSPNPSASGASVTLTATVTPSGATGSVQFFNGTTLLGTATLSNGQAQFSTTALPVGTDSLTAAYQGDANNTNNTSSAIQQTVNQASTTTTLTSSPNPSTFGVSVTLTASVTPSTATGSVQFFNGTTLLGTATLSNGQAQFSTTALPVGTDSLTATYQGDTNYTSSTSGAIQQTVNKASTTTSLTNSPNPSNFGASVTLTATVTPSSATGSVQFFNGTTLLGTATLSNGQAQFSTTALPVGTDSLTATYQGDANDTSSTSSAIQQTVNRASTTITLAIAGSSPSPYGSPVTFTSIVSPSSATGTVQFFTGTTLVGSVNLNGGSAQFTTTTLPVGQNSLTAVYSGDANDAGSTSSATQLTVSKANTTATLSANPSTSTFGQAVTLTATLLPSSATGSVQFYSGNTLLGSANVSGGQAQFSTTALPTGTNSLSAVYSGDANDAATTANPIQQTVNKASTATSLTSSPNPSTVGASVTLTATVTPSGATGTVQFFNGSTLLGSGNLSSGKAQFTTAALPAGTNSLTATYTGDSNYASSSGATQQTVNKLSTTTSLTTSPNPSTVGAPVTLTATVTPSTASGSVQFFNGSTLLGSANLSNGQAQLTTNSLPAGANSLTATYGGDANNAASSSSATLETVNKLSTTTSLTSSPSPSTFGGSVTLTANVTPSSATGPVQFFNGSTLLGSANLSGGQAQFTTTALPAGTDSLTAGYAGDATNAASVSSARLQAVNKVNSTTTLSASPSSSNVGQTVTFTASVTPASATGTVKFMNGGSQMGTATLSNGVAAFSISTLTSGTHSIKAVYSGDGNVHSSQSSTLNYHVH